jgi:hypothetical protein
METECFLSKQFALIVQGCKRFKNQKSLFFWLIAFDVIQRGR